MGFRNLEGFVMGWTICFGWSGGFFLLGLFLLWLLEGYPVGLRTFVYVLLGYLFLKIADPVLYRLGVVHQSSWSGKATQQMVSTKNISKTVRK